MTARSPIATPGALGRLGAEARSVRSTEDLASRVHLAYGGCSLMVASGWEQSVRRFANRAICVLLALATLAFIAATSTPSHLHAFATTGLYNAQCPLAELAARQGLSSLAPAPPSCWSDFTPAGAIHFAAGGISAPVVPDTESR